MHSAEHYERNTDYSIESVHSFTENSEQQSHSGACFNCEINFSVVV